MLNNKEKSKSNTERNDVEVNMMKNGLSDLKEEIEDMSEEDKETKNPKWNSRFCWKQSGV